MRFGRPDLSRKELELVERGLREWFICCAWRWGTAWDRSEAGQEEESVLWDLDKRLGIAEPLGIDGAVGGGGGS